MSDQETSPEDSPKDSSAPEVPQWQKILSQVIATVWVFGAISWVTYFTFFYEGVFERPLGFLQEMMICATASSMFAALLTQLLFSQGALKGTFKGVSFTFTGAAAVFFLLLFLYFNFRPVDQYPTAVVYTVNSSTNSQIRMANFRARQVGEQVGGQVTIFRESIDNATQWKLIVVYPPEVYSAKIRISTDEGMAEFKLFHTDRQTGKTNLLVPSGEVKKED